MDTAICHNATIGPPEIIHTPAIIDRQATGEIQPQAIPEPETKTWTGTATTTGKAFKQLVTQVCKFAPKSHPNPMFQHIEIDIQADQEEPDGYAGMLVMKATDGDNAKIQHLDLRFNIQPADIPLLVPAQLLQKLAMKFAKRPELTIALIHQHTRTPNTKYQTDETGKGHSTWTGTYDTADTYTVRIIAGGSEYNLTAQPVDESYMLATATDYRPSPGMDPQTPDHITAIAGDVMKAALNRLTFAAVKESSTGAIHYTNSVYMEFGNPEDRTDDTVTMVTTDGHRLACETIPWINYESTNADHYLSVLVPVHRLEIIAAQLNTTHRAYIAMRHAYTDRKVIITQESEDGGSTWIIQEYDVRFPPYRRVIPKDIPAATATVESADLLEALDRLTIMATQKDQNPVTYIKSGTTETGNHYTDVTTDGGDHGTACETLESSNTGDDLNAAVNPRYIADTVKATKARKLTIHWHTPIAPLVITADTAPAWTYIMMPIRMD